MGLLTTDQKTAIAAGAPIAHRFELMMPVGSGLAPADWADYGVFHDDTGAVAVSPCVTDPGQIRVEAYNVSMREPGRFGIANYVFEIDNSTGRWSPYHASTWFHTEAFGTYDPDPLECWIKHQVFVKVGATWSEITGVAYTGRIIEIEYNATDATATITCEAVVSELLRQTWEESDSVDVDTTLDMVL